MDPASQLAQVKLTDGRCFTIRYPRSHDYPIRDGCKGAKSGGGLVHFIPSSVMVFWSSNAANKILTQRPVGLSWTGLWIGRMVYLTYRATGGSR